MKYTEEQVCAILREAFPLADVYFNSGYVQVVLRIAVPGRVFPLLPGKQCAFDPAAGEVNEPDEVLRGFLDALKHIVVNGGKVLDDREKRARHNLAAFVTRSRDMQEEPHFPEEML